MSSEEKWTPPPVQVGCVVLFRHSPTDKGEAAIVTEVGDQAICVSVVAPLARALFPKQSVRHKDDPDLKARVQFAEGTWEHTDQTKMLLECQAALSARAGDPSKKNRPPIL